MKKPSLVLLNAKLPNATLSNATLPAVTLPTATLRNGTLPAVTLPAILFAACLSVFAHLSLSAQTITVPLGGNAWSNHPGDTTRGQVTADGITGWNDPSTGFSVWFRVSRTGRLNISLLASVPSGSSTISVSLGGGGAMEHELTLKGSRLHESAVGNWEVRDTGYQVVVLRGIQRSGALFANIQSLSLSGPAVAGPVAFVPDNKGNFFYWGRRGPSVHLNYAIATDATTPSPANASLVPRRSTDATTTQAADRTSPLPNSIEWFYNEVTVPVDQDVIGSYFMADGFSDGYFGMQVNSATERRILFSVWSPFATDNPSAIPDSLRVRLVKKGADVHAGSFGDEGSGGQSYLVYPWVAGRTYRFLLRAQPMTASAAPAASSAGPKTPSSEVPAPSTGARASVVSTPSTAASGASTPASSFTRFTAWFYTPESGDWRLIASWDRPATYTWLEHLHSFLENFEPDYGDQGRRALFSNQWIRDSAGRWSALTRARFTGDNTARRGYRLDYAGGSTSDGFWLRNGGFLSSPTPLDTWLSRPNARRSPPDIDLSHLP